MNIKDIITKYRSRFKHAQEILEVFEHDLKHMGLEADQVRSYLNEAKQYLEKEKIL